MRHARVLAPWAACAVAASILAWPSSAAAHGAGEIDRLTAIPRVDLAVQPVVPVGGAPTDEAFLLSLAEDAGAWLSRVSQGRAAIESVSLRPSITAPSASCRDLAGVVAEARQREESAGADRVLYVGQSADCPYLGLAETPGRWLLVPSVAGARQAVARTVAHELGHTFGLQHAAALTCPILTDEARPGPCSLDEYGDRTDTMGRGAAAWGLGPLTLAQAAWGDGLSRIESPGTHAIEVLPLSSAGPDGVEFADPVSGDRYALAYRSPDGPVNPADPGTGVYLYRLPRAGEEQVGSVLLPWISSLTRPLGGRPGYTFTAPSGAVALRVVSLDSMAARVTLRIDPTGALVDSVGPVFADGGPTRAGAAVRIPRAIDQAGIGGYEIAVDGVVVRRLAPHEGNASQTVKLTRRMAQGQTVTVSVVDGRGNTTRVEPVRVAKR